jgi:uroporphyrinogen-III synthase
LLIHPPASPETAAARLVSHGPYHIAVFISPNAVRYGLELLHGGSLPGNPLIAAVGKGTARALEAAGVAVDILPRERFDSEALLETPELRGLEGRRVLILRGNGGRPLLGDDLRARGAEVVYAEVYRRECPDADAGPLLRHWSDQVQVVTATSCEILENLTAIFGEAGRTRLTATPLVVISERMRGVAQALGFREIILARRAEDGAIVDALCHWVAGRKTI